MSDNKLTFDNTTDLDRTLFGIKVYDNKIKEEFIKNLQLLFKWQ